MTKLSQIIGKMLYSHVSYTVDCCVEWRISRVSYHRGYSITGEGVFDHGIRCWSPAEQQYWWTFPIISYLGNNRYFARKRKHSNFRSKIRNLNQDFWWKKTGWVMPDLFHQRLINNYNFVVTVTSSNNGIPRHEVN